MADAEILERVKSALGITGVFLDNTISLYIDEVVCYMQHAGVSDDMISGLLQEELPIYGTTLPEMASCRHTSMMV